MMFGGGDSGDQFNSASASVKAGDLFSRIPTSAFQTFDAANALASLGKLIGDELKKKLESGDFGTSDVPGNDDSPGIPHGPVVGSALRTALGKGLASLLFA